MATTYQVFEQAERIERTAAELYRLLAEQFAADPAARALFRRLEEEEHQHASRVHLLAARYRHDSRLLPAPGDPQLLEAILADLEQVVASARRGTFARTVEEARVNLAALEERAAHAHAELIAREGHPALREFSQKLAEQDRGHEELLRGG